MDNDDNKAIEKAAVANGGFPLTFTISVDAAVAASDRLLRRFLTAPTRLEAERRFDRLHSEFIGPIITSVISEELRRGVPTTPEEIYAETDALHDLALLIRGKLAVRLFQQWQQMREAEHREDRQFHGQTISHIRAYVDAVARHACVDYLRRRHPGRHGLDESLRAVFGASPEFELWRAPEDARGVQEWRCGTIASHVAGRDPVSLRLDETLQARLRYALDGLDRGRALAVVFAVANAPLRYTELVDFLANLWDSEAPYRAAEHESVPFRVPKPYLSGFQPEETAELLGTLQEVWEAVQQLRPNQAAVLLLRLPMLDGGTYLDVMVRSRIAEWADIAQVIGLPVQRLWSLSAEMPLADADIASVIGVSPEEVPRIRQDARRRLRGRRGSTK